MSHSSNGQDAPGVSVIIPTFREAENIPVILEQLSALQARDGRPMEVLFMDDNSDDGSVEAVARAGVPVARIIVRRENRGLSPAVIDGFRAARYPVLVCMDCDLSHPVEAIPKLALGLEAGAQMMIGSRYVAGGGTDDDWGMLRWINSGIATLLARPFTSVRDPMSGFFALRKRDFDAIAGLNPVGYKIALELIVKGAFDNVGEVPIHFRDRVRGESKLTLREQLLYLKHLRRLYLHRFANAMYLMQFLAVGTSGVAVNLITLTGLSAVGLSDGVSLAGGIVVSLTTNFLLNRRFTFSYARSGPFWRQYLSFAGTCALGGAINLLVALAVRDTAWFPEALTLQLAALCGILSGMVFNFLGSRFWVFRKRYVRRP